MPSPRNLKNAIYDKLKRTDLLRMTGMTISFKFNLIVVAAAFVGLFFVLLKIGGILRDATNDMVLVAFGIIFFSSLLLITVYYRKTIKRFIKEARNSLYEDALTGIRNFVKFQMDAEDIIKESPDKQWYIVSIDINNFKYINDAYGYPVGDETLVYIADAIGSLLNEGEISCRVGGDEFAILLARRDLADLDRFFGEFRSKVKEAPICIRHKYFLKFNAGVYIVQPQNRIPVAAMYDRAKLAYGSVQQKNGVDYYIFDEELRENILREKQIEQDMYAALENGEFEIYLQPKWDIQNGDTIVGAETLVRWNSPTRGMLYPSDFMPVLEKSGFIVEVDRYIFELVCSYFRNRLDSMLPVIPLSVNISEQDIKQPDFVDYYVSTKDRYKIPDGLLQLEFTESIVYEDIRSISLMIRKLQENGFVCSIDDFGKGNSSLNAIMDLPVNDLKLDMVFFRENNLHERTEAVLKSIISMAKALGMKTVAEGVESKNQVEFLRRVGCDEIQGYIFAKPMPARLMDDYINSIPKRRILENTDRKPAAVRSQILRDPHSDERFFAALEFVDAVVTEIDLDMDVYHVIGDHSLNAMVKQRNGYYDQSLRRNAAERIHPSDQEMYLRLFSVMGIKSAFYRGEKRISHRFRALDSRNREYIWFEMTVLKLESGERNRAICFLRNVHFRKWMEENGGEDRVRLANTVLNLYSHVYEFDLDALSYRKLALKNGQYENGGQYGDLINQISRLTAEHQRHDFAEFFSPGNLRRLLSGNGLKTVQAEYKLLIRNEYRWHSMTIAAEKNSPNRLLALCFIQDIHDSKNEILERSTKYGRFKDMIMSSIKNIVEINLQKDTYSDIGNDATDAIADSGHLYDSQIALFRGNGRYSEAFEQVVRNCIHPDDRQHIERRFSKDALMETLFKAGQSEITDRCRIIRKDGGYDWFRIFAMPENPGTDKSTVYLYYKSVEDISYENGSDTGEGERESLTGLYNRQAFEQIAGSILDSRTNGHLHALLLVEVDCLNEIIAKYGHMAGDEVLRSMAALLNGCFRSEDVIGRIDSSRFAVFMRNVISTESAKMKADQIRRSFRGPMSREPINDIVTCSVGVAVSGRDASEYKQLFGNARQALARAKAEGKGRVRLYSGIGQILR